MFVLVQIVDEIEYRSVLERLVLKNVAQRTSHCVKWRCGARDMISSLSLFILSDTLEEDFLRWENLPSMWGNLLSAWGNLPSRLKR